MTDRERTAALRQGAEKGASFVAIKREDLLWLLDQVEKKSASNKQSEKPQETAQ